MKSRDVNILEPSKTDALIQPARTVRAEIAGQTERSNLRRRIRLADRLHRRRQIGVVVRRPEMNIRLIQNFIRLNLSLQVFRDRRNIFFPEIERGQNDVLRIPAAHVGFLTPAELAHPFRLRFIHRPAAERLNELDASKNRKKLYIVFFINRHRTVGMREIKLALLRLNRRPLGCRHPAVVLAHQTHTDPRQHLRNAFKRSVPHLIPRAEKLRRNCIVESSANPDAGLLHQIKRTRRIFADNRIETFVTAVRAVYGDPHRTVTGQRHIKRKIFPALRIQNHFKRTAEKLGSGQGIESADRQIPANG